MKNLSKVLVKIFGQLNFNNVIYPQQGVCPVAALHDGKKVRLPVGKFNQTQYLLWVFKNLPPLNF
jgi:hypothetical protein